MSTREKAVRLLNVLSDRDLEIFIRLFGNLYGMADEWHEKDGED